MIFRLLNWAILGIVGLYVAEGIGIVPRGQYFPSLPRLEASAADPGAWLGAMQWGAIALGDATGLTQQARSLESSVRGSVPAVRSFGGYYGG